MEKTFKIVALNETYGLDESVKAKTGELYVCYVFDPEQRVHCCEITPSYELWPCGFYTEKEIDDDLHSNLAAGEDNIIYTHCHSIDAMDDSFKTELEMEFDEDDMQRGDVFLLEKAVEELQANVKEPPHAFTL